MKINELIGFLERAADTCGSDDVLVFCQFFDEQGESVQTEITRVWVEFDLVTRDASVVLL